MARVDWDIYDSAGLSNGVTFLHSGLSSPLTGHGTTGLVAHATTPKHIAGLCRRAGRENLSFQTSTFIKAWMRHRPDPLGSAPYMSLYLAHPDINPTLASEAAVPTGYNLTFYNGNAYLQAFAPGAGSPADVDFSVVAWSGATVNVWWHMWLEREYVSDTRIILRVYSAPLASPDTWTLRHSRTINNGDVGFYTGIQETMGFELNNGGAAGPTFPAAWIDGVECGSYIPGAFS